MRFISFRLGSIVLPALSLLLFSPQAVAQRGWTDARNLVGHSQRDLSEISGVAVSLIETARYNNAMHHLSLFDEALAHGHFMKDKLDQSIHDISAICENNELWPSQRAALLHDMRELIDLRNNWRENNHPVPIL